MSTKRDRLLSGLFFGLLTAVGLALVVFLSMVNILRWEDCRAHYSFSYCLFMR